jgi:hypothetical protein
VLGGYGIGTEMSFSQRKNTLANEAWICTVMIGRDSEKKLGEFFIFNPEFTTGHSEKARQQGCQIII